MFSWTPWPGSATRLYPVYRMEREPHKELKKYSNERAAPGTLALLGILSLSPVYIPCCLIMLPKKVHAFYHMCLLDVFIYSLLFLDASETLLSMKHPLSRSRFLLPNYYTTQRTQSHVKLSHFPVCLFSFFLIYLLIMLL